jgi:hypothetical protein
MQDVEPSIALQRIGYHELHGLLIRSVRRVDRAPPAFLFNSMLQSTRTLLGAIDEHDSRAFAGKEHRDGTAVTNACAARSGAGHDRHLACKPATCPGERHKERAMISRMISELPA